MPSKIVSVKLHPAYVEMLDALVNRGYFESRSAALRFAIAMLYNMIESGDEVVSIHIRMNRRIYREIAQAAKSMNTSVDVVLSQIIWHGLRTMLQQRDTHAHISYQYDTSHERG